MFVLQKRESELTAADDDEQCHVGTRSSALVRALVAIWIKWPLFTAVEFGAKTIVPV